MSLSLQFLGTGTSVGVPQIGCKCPACTSADPRDRRRRTGVYVRSGDTAFLVDAPPEMREACIELGVCKVDAVVITHAHMDHIAGFDDVRRFNTINGGVVLKCYAAPETIASMRQIFPYISTKANALGLFRPMIDFTPVTRAFRIGRVKVTPLPVEHGGPRTNGYLFEADGRRMAYISDCISIPPRTMAKIRDVDMMVVDCLRERFHPTHMNLERSLAALSAARARRGCLVHMSHSVVHAEFSRLLPRHVRLAHDGLVLRA
jgi:phosphoribosyl 1,2-cyclic phosphate phosphodiesterase